MDKTKEMDKKIKRSKDNYGNWYQNSNWVNEPPSFPESRWICPKSHDPLSTALRCTLTKT